MNPNEHGRATLPPLANHTPVNLTNRRPLSISDLKLTSPKHARQPSYGYTGSYSGPPNGVQYQNMPPRHQEDHYVQGGSDLKRRRHTNGGSFVPVLPHHPPDPRYSVSSPLRDRFGNPMEPPRYVHGVVAPFQPQQQQQTRPLDRSLTLAPTLSPANASFSAESIHMSVSVLGKIRVLGRISPPYKAKKTDSSAAKEEKQARGLIIAIEGDNEYALSNLVSFLRDQLNSEDDLFVKVSHGPALDPRDGPLTLSHSHELMINWRQKNQEMIDFIVAPLSQIEKTSVRMSLDNDAKYESASRLGITYHENYDDDGDDDDSASQVSPKDTSKMTGAPYQDSHGSDATGTPSTQAKIARTPVLLMHHYQLHATNIYASMTEVDDQYSAVDHWQWMATLWRGTVGPDVTIYLKDCGPEEMAREPPIVEVREDVRSVIVRREKEVPRGVVQERTLRRLRFEISELVRAGGFHNRLYGQMGAGGQGTGDERQGTNSAGNPRSRSS